MGLMWVPPWPSYHFSSKGSFGTPYPKTGRLVANPFGVTWHCLLSCHQASRVSVPLAGSFPPNEGFTARRRILPTVLAQILRVRQSFFPFGTVLVGPGSGQTNPLRQQGKVAGPLGGEDTVPALGHLGPDLEDGPTLKIRSSHNAPERKN